MKTFKIPSLLATGLLSNAVIADTSEVGKATIPEENEFLKIINSIDSDTKNFTLQAHRSHASHGSHGSHGSHRSGYFSPGIIDEPLATNIHGDTTERNDLSTPANSVLPSSPGIFKVKKLKGGSEDFKLLVIRVQFALSKQGYEIGSIDGSLDAKTMAAIYKFQTNSKLIPSGQITDELVRLLEINAV